VQTPHYHDERNNIESMCQAFIITIFLVFSIVGMLLHCAHSVCYLQFHIQRIIRNECKLSQFEDDWKVVFRLVSVCYVSRSLLCERSGQTYKANNAQNSFCRGKSEVSFHTVGLNFTEV